MLWLRWVRPILCAGSKPSARLWTTLHAASRYTKGLQNLAHGLAVSIHFFCAALATELPSPDLLLESPHGRTESVINRRMWKHILVQGCYQILVLFLVIFGGPKLIGDYAVRTSVPSRS